MVSRIRRPRVLRAWASKSAAWAMRCFSARSRCWAWSSTRSSTARSITSACSACTSPRAIASRVCSWDGERLGEADLARGLGAGEVGQSGEPRGRGAEPASGWHLQGLGVPHRPGLELVQPGLQGTSRPTTCVVSGASSDQVGASTRSSSSRSSTSRNRTIGCADPVPSRCLLMDPFQHWPPTVRPRKRGYQQEERSRLDNDFSTPRKDTMRAESCTDRGPASVRLSRLE